MFKNKDYVLAIYREGSFSKAAEKLYVSQPSLSATIKRLENKISMPIFNRSTSPVTLTQTGKKYIEYALEIEQKEQDFLKYISDTAKLLCGKIRIGGRSLFSSYMLPKMISDFNKVYPQIIFEICEGNTKDLIDKLNIGVLDLIIDNSVLNDESINSTVFINECLVIAVPQKFDINRGLDKYVFTADDIKSNLHYDKARYLSLEIFKNEPFIFLNPQNDTGKRAQRVFKNINADPKIIFSLDQQVTAYNISASGMGISFVSDTLIKNTSTQTALNYYIIDDSEIFRNIYFYNKSNRYLSVPCKKFIEYSIFKKAKWLTKNF